MLQQGYNLLTAGERDKASVRATVCVSCSRHNESQAQRHRAEVSPMPTPEKFICSAGSTGHTTAIAQGLLGPKGGYTHPATPLGMLFAANMFTLMISSCCRLPHSPDWRPLCSPRFVHCSVAAGARRHEEDAQHSQDQSTIQIH